MSHVCETKNNECGLLVARMAELNSAQKTDNKTQQLLSSEEMCICNKTGWGKYLYTNSKEQM